MSEQLSLQEILSLVNQTNKQFDSTVYIPSLNKEVYVKSMNASHLKSVIRTAVAGVFANNVFNQITYDILKDVLDPSIPLSNITVFDKLVILLQLRMINVKNTIGVTFTSDEKTVSMEMFIADFTKNLKLKTFNFEVSTVTDGTYEAEICFPSIENEYQFERNFAQTKIKGVDQSDLEALKNLFDPLFIKEICMYIKSVKIDDQYINLLAHPVEARLSIVEKLSSSLITKILDTIDTKYSSQLKELLTVTETVNGAIFTGSVEIGPDIFT
jgi:hypothetical protein